jgi:hypothetical protein
MTLVSLRLLAWGMVSTTVTSALVLASNEPGVRHGDRPATVAKHDTRTQPHANGNGNTATMQPVSLLRSRDGLATEPQRPMLPR